MGLMDSLVGAAVSSIAGNAAGSTQNPAMQLAMQLIQQNGGVGGLMGQLQQGGLGDALSSWVSTGANQSVSGQDLQNAFGSEQLQQAAAAAGVDHSQAGDLLAQVLPQLINGMTPNGNASDADGFGLDDIAKIAMQQFMK